MLLDHPKANSALIVATRQKQNPVLRHIRSVPKHVNDGPTDIAVDFIAGSGTGIIFVSVSFARAYRDYVRQKLEAFKREGVTQHYRNKIIILLYDSKINVSDYVDEDTEENSWSRDETLPPDADVLEFVQIMAFSHGWTVLVAWDDVEAASYIEHLFKYQGKTAHMIQGYVKAAGEGQQVSVASRKETLVEVITSIKGGLSKRDAIALATKFPSLAELCAASREELVGVPGIGGKKLQSLWSALHDPIFPEERS